MKPHTLMCATAATLFAALANPTRMNAQGLQETSVHHRYKLIDIGTFGGPASFINPPVNGGLGLNMQGSAVGGAATSVPRPANSKSFICGGLDGSVPFIFHAFEWHDGEVADLGALPPATNTCSNAQSVNERREIVGSSENGLIDPVSGANQFHAVLWMKGEIKDLGTLGGTSSQASQNNNKSQITGFAYNATPDPFTPNGTEIRAFLWQNGHMKDLGTLGGPDVIGAFINERGQVAGLSLTDSIANPSTGIPTQDPFLWTEETGMIDIGTLGGVAGGPSALNNRGQVVGESNLVGDQDFHPFLWDDGKLIDLFTATIGGNPVSANAINDAGEIVGAAAFSTNRPFDAYIWKNGVATDLGTLPGDCFSEAFAINSRSQVVGQSFSCITQTGRTFLWDNGTMIDLNAFVPPGSGLQLVEAVAINDRGEIAGDLVPPGCGGGRVPTQGNDAKCGHAFVLIPCDGDHADSESCQDADAASQSVEEDRAAHPVPAQTTATQPNLTPTEMRDRVRSLLFNRNRRFRTLQPK